MEDLNKLLNIYYKTGKIEDKLMERIDEIEQKWKPVIDPKLGEVNYEVSDMGFVRNSITKQILKPFYRKLYLAVKLCKDGNEHTESLHRIVASAFVKGKTELKNEVDHLNGIKECNMASNLEWVPRSEQILRAYRLGLIKVPVGEDKIQAKYSNEFVIKLCGLMELGLSLPELAIHMGVEKDASFKWLVDGIKSKNRWTFISDNFTFPSMKEVRNVWVEPIIRDTCDKLAKGVSYKIILFYLYQLFPCRSKKVIRRFINNIINKTIFTEISDEYF